MKKIIDRGQQPGLRLRLIILYTCVISGTVTYLTLSFAAAAGKKQAAMRTVTPGVERYKALGYSQETVTSKKNVLLSVTDNGSLCRTHLFTFDLDKHTLDILEIPPQTEILADGFDGTAAEAYETDVYKEIIGRGLMLKIDCTVSMEADTVSRCATALGGIPICIAKPVTIGETVFTKGKRTLAGSKAGIIAADGEGYISREKERVMIYRRLAASFISKMKEEGAAGWFPKLMDIIINEAKTDMDISSLLELISIADSVYSDKISIFLLPGWVSGEFYLADPDKTAELLNERFRVKGNVFENKELGFAAYENPKEEYPDLEEKIEKIIK